MPSRSISRESYSGKLASQPLASLWHGSRSKIMDDAWFHTFTSSSPASAAQKPQHRRRPSLLQQPADQDKADIAPEPRISEERETYEDPWIIGPPSPTLARRAQSYSDFYDAVTAYGKTLGRQKPQRKQSLDTLRRTTGQDESPELVFQTTFADLEDEVLEQSHAKYTSHHAQLQVSQAHLDTLLTSAADTLQTLIALSSSFNAVEAQTEAFRQQCEALITEQKRLELLADAITDNASYYTYLEPMTRRLNAPGAANLVKGKDFPELLANLDNCLAFMEAHPSHKESASYRSKYRLLLTRALTLVRHHFTKSLGDIATDITRRVQSGQLKETTHSALLYAKFRVPAPELKALGLEIHKRAKPTLEDVDSGREPEYMSLMRELYQSYSTTRGRLILPLVSRKMAELTTSYQPTDLLGFARASLAFVRGIVLDEYELWFEWFEQGTETGLYDFLESLMEPMYDYLRPRTIHETKLEKLCELCGMIQDRYGTASSDSEDEDGAIESTEVSGSNSPVGNGIKHAYSKKPLDFGSLVQPALEDAQTRLVFLALNVLRDGIENFKPKPEDLKWPRKPEVQTNGAKKGPTLSGTRESTKTTATLASHHTPLDPNKADDDEDLDDSLSVLSKQMGIGDNAATTSKERPEAWYPTLRKSLWLLRRIYRLVNSSVFDDLAHRIVNSTTHSLLSASTLILKQPNAAPADAHLFAITHFLHLKQQIVAFDIEFIPPDVSFDFSSVTNTFYELRDRGALWNPTSWVRLVGGAVGGGLIPKVVENMLDAKAELDGRLRSAINDFVSLYAGHITAPIDPKELAALKSHNAHAFDALKAVRTVRGLAEKHTPLLRAKLDEWLDDARVRETLIAAVRDQVIMVYEDFFDTYLQDKGVKISKKGKGREDEVWGPKVFAEGMEKIFRVGDVVSSQDDTGSVSE